MNDYPNCPKCNSEYTYEDGSMYVCPECAYEWSQHAETEADLDE
ncbi:MAG: alkylphosphonate utilization protein, partial [Candidatus Cellulosilyticum pullistercoris]|nr:alkylphosphonate utilization protein [Candidatus Cellulosilyticum pullistercoris]